MICDLVLLTSTLRAGFQFQIEAQMHFLPLGAELFNLKSALLPCSEWRGKSSELLLVILSGLSEVLRDSIKSYVFWSSCWV